MLHQPPCQLPPGAAPAATVPAPSHCALSRSSLLLSVPAAASTGSELTPRRGGYRQGGQGPAPLSRLTQLLARGPVSAPGGCRPPSLLWHPGPPRSQPDVQRGSRHPCALPAALGRAGSFQHSPVRTLPQNPVTLVG